MEVDETDLESTDQYFPTCLRISDVSRVAEGITNKTHRADILRQLSTVHTRLSSIWAIHDAEEKLLAAGTDSRLDRRTCNRLRDFVDYVFGPKNPKDTQHLEKQKVLQNVSWPTFRLHSMAFPIEKTRNMNVNILQQVTELEGECIASRGLQPFLDRLEFRETLATHAVRVRACQNNAYAACYEAFQAAQPTRLVEPIPENLQVEASLALHKDSEGSGPQTYSLHGQVYRLSAIDLRDAVYSYKCIGEPCVLTVPASISHSPFVFFTTTNTMTMKFMQRPKPQNDQLRRIVDSVVKSWTYRPVEGECWVCSPEEFVCSHTAN